MSAGIQALVVSSDRSPSPSPQIHPPTPLYPLLGAFWVAALHRGRQSRSLEPLAVGVGGLTHLAPSLIPMGQPPRPWALAPGQAPGFRKRKLQPRGA